MTKTAKLAHRAEEPLRVVPVEGRRVLRRFLEVPRIVHGADPAWVPPLLAERRRHLSRANPFFEHARARLWVALRGERPVGRISAQIDPLHLERHADATGYFGLLDAVDDAAVFHALFGAAEDWLQAQGMRRALGPFSLSINDECGLLVEGFDTPPMFLMPHGRPYYDGRVREQGYARAKDTLAYLLDASVTPPAVMEAAVRKACGGRLRVRPLRLDRLESELALLRDIFNDAWSANWGFVPFTAPEMRDLGRSLRLFVPSDFVEIAEVDGEPAAMIVLLPNLNEVIQPLGGRLLPFGWLRLLWRLRRVRTARVVLMGVRREHQRSALAMALVFSLIEALREPVARRGVREVELSWILEDNAPIHHLNRRIGARPYKRYRFYEKALNAAG